MHREQFLDGCNIVVFEHLVISPGLAESITRHIADPLDDNVHKEVRKQLRTLVEEKIAKYSDPEVARQIKLIYLFLGEGIQGMAAGRTLADQQEAEVKRIFAGSPRPKRCPRMEVIGIGELRPIFAQVEARLPGIRLAEFLLKKDGKGGYDTPKIAASLLQLARQDYMRQEMFIRLDDDVRPSAAGLRELKRVYFSRIHDPANRPFCFSWHYEREPLESIEADVAAGPSYDQLFAHLVNSYSIRTTFMGESSLRCRWDPDSGRLSARLPKDQKVRLNVLHVKRFLDLFQLGCWGSDLDDPISGAGMCFNPDSLAELPPWTCADEMITWIDDFIKWQLMRGYYGDRFAGSLRLVRVPGCPGFCQTRNEPAELRVSDVEWAANTYLDRLMMGCILSYCVDPPHYGGEEAGFAELLQERDYLSALVRWEGSFQQALAAGAARHVGKILDDWHRHFCQTAAEPPDDAGSLPSPPCGFVPAPSDTFFNAYTLKQQLALQDGTFTLIDKVLAVLRDYLKMKYRFWPQVVEAIGTLRSRYSATRHAAPNDPLGEPTTGQDWLFLALDDLGDPEPVAADRISEASLALIPEVPGVRDTRLLLQWNRKWRVMHFIGGHLEPEDPNGLGCVLREVHEELFGELDEVELQAMRAAIACREQYDATGAEWKSPYVATVKPSVAPPHDFPEYVAFSESKQEWTRYRLKLYEVVLTPQGRAALFDPDPFWLPKERSKPEGPNEWASRADVARGWTALGRPISPTTRTILDGPCGSEVARGG